VANDRYWARTVVIDVLFSFYFFHFFPHPYLSSATFPDPPCFSQITTFYKKCLIDFSSNFSCVPVGEGTQETGYRPVPAPAQQDDVRGSLRGSRLRHHRQVRSARKKPVFDQFRPRHSKMMYRTGLPARVSAQAPSAGT
jgi:hypothetical protein